MGNRTVPEAWASDLREHQLGTGGQRAMSGVNTLDGAGRRQKEQRVDKQGIREQLNKELEQHDPNTAEGLAYWQQNTAEAYLDTSEQAGSLLAGVIEGRRTLADLSADETALLLGLLANLSNLIGLFILYPRQRLAELLAEVGFAEAKPTPQYTADENLEA